MKYTYGWQNKDVGFSVLKGLRLKSIDGLRSESENVTFNTECGRQFKMYHEQDCCELVDINDVCGDVSDLIGAEIIHAEERNNECDGINDDSATWTFYDIQTTKGSVNIKWLGESNGYYSESVTFCEGKKESND